MTPPLKWHGGKHYLAKDLIALMPQHLHYVEPYFGGGAVLLAKDPEGVSEVVNDLDGRLTNFWRCLACPLSFGEFQRLADALPFCEQFWEEAKEKLEKPCNAKGTICINCALAFFACCRQSMSGRMRSFSPITRRRTRSGMNEQASAWIGCVEGLAEVHQRLRRVVITGPRDALDVIRQQDGSSTLFYCDPPYMHTTRNGHTPKDYAHEMSDQQHLDLLSTLGLIEGKFLLSGYATELYTAAATKYGWTLHTFQLPNNAAWAAEKRRMTECVWTNF